VKDSNQLKKIAHKLSAEGLIILLSGTEIASGLKLTEKEMNRLNQAINNIQSIIEELS